MHYLALFAALMLSSIAAFFSVAGLAAIFASSFIPIIVMGTALELTKVITVMWVHLYWDRLSIFVRTYLSVAVIMLMAITSMGIYGFLTKAHIQHQVEMQTGVAQQLKFLESDISNIQQKIDQINKTITNDQAPIDKLVELSQKSADARSAFYALKETKKDRVGNSTQLSELQQKILELNKRKIEMEGKQLIEQAEVGPIKYMADWWYGGQASQNQIERAISWLTVILVLCFDPLAMMLVVGTNLRFETVIKRRNGTIEIPEHHLANYE